MNITEMQEKHLPALAALEKQCFHAPWSEKMLREELGGGIFLVAEQDGEVQGYVGCQTVLDEGYITNVAVSPDFRRRGAARLLIAELIARAKEKGLAFVTSRCARATRLPSRCMPGRALPRSGPEKIFTAILPKTRF